MTCGEGLTELDKVIMVQAGGMELGIHADAVSGMRSVALKEIKPPLPTLTGIRQRYLKGITTEQVTILDMEKLLLSCMMRSRYRRGCVHKIEEAEVMKLALGTKRDQRSGEAERKDYKTIFQ